MVDGVLVEELGGDDLLDNLLKNLRAEVSGGDHLGVLGGDDDGVDAERDGSAALLLVLNGDLSLGVRAKPAELTGAAGISHGGVELVSKHDGQGHELLSLVGGVTEHDTLITGTVILEGAVVKALRDIRGLLLDGDEDVAGLVVEALGGVIVANLLDGVADDTLVVELGLGGDLAEDHDHAGLGCGLASDLGVGILGKAGIELNASGNERDEKRYTWQGDIR